jgi:hypothetical protein
VWSNDPESYAGSSYMLLVGSHMQERSRVMTQTKKKYSGPPGWGWT